MRYLKQALWVFFALALLCGIIYPFFITALAQLLFPQKANGSIMISGNTTVGSALIGQQFDNPRYFHGRPSATDPAYNASGSTGSNFGPTNSYFLEEVQKRIEKARKENGLSTDTPIPGDFVLTSASGLDPHVSVGSAMLQVKRIAKERGMSEAEVEAMVRRHIEQPFGSIWGEARVNILKLNLALDAQERMRK
jgi:K+-transporting ATPase ATPase C chain